ncbi:MAG: beta-phosphoglucomutase family hydrolase [Gammaproteobacteria bacterium]
MDPKLARYRAVLFDLDGVLTDTASVHAACWKRMFDEFLRERAARTGEPFEAFDIVSDYQQYVDGKPRYDGVRSFLASRRIRLPEGEPSDPPGSDTVCALGNRKNLLIREFLRQEGVEPYPDAVQLLEDLSAAGVSMAVVSSSKNAPAVLDAAGIADRFDTVVDGKVAADSGLPGKPAPDTFLDAARRLGVDHREAVVVEDAISGVKAGRNGEFGLVVGVARQDNADELRAAGADVVVTELSELAGESDEPQRVS